MITEPFKCLHVHAADYVTHNPDIMTLINQEQVLCSKYAFKCMFPAVPHHEIV